MMKELSPKNAVFAVFYILILGSCVPTGGISVFINSEEVKDFVEAIENVVRVDDQTGDNLKGRKSSIEGLKPNRYYMISKEIDEDENLVGDERDFPKYVTDYTDQGGLTKDLGLITKIRRGIIWDLTPLHTYTVRAAELFQGDLTYKEGAGPEEPIQVEDGIINITKNVITGKGNLSFSKVISGNEYYEVIAVSDSSQSSPWNWKSRSIDSSNGYSITLEGPKKKFDYVFVNSDFSEFKVLTVIVGASTGPISIDKPAIQGVTVPVAGEEPIKKITDNEQYDCDITWNNGNPSIFAVNTYYVATIKVTPKPGYIFDNLNLKFTVDGATSVTTVFTGSTDASRYATVTANFPRTANTVTILDIPGITAPIALATPLKPDINTMQYTGTVTWDGNPAKFDYNTVYKATITLTANSGYTFYGVSADSFTLAGITTATVKNNADSGVITVEFPRTGFPPNANSFGVNLSFTIGDKASITPSSATISRGNFTTGPGVTLTLAAPNGAAGGGTWSDVVWYIGDISKNGNSVVINNTSEFWPVLNGNFYVYVTAELSGNTKPNGNGYYSGRVLITVTN